MKIHIADYSPTWPELFATEKAQLAPLLPEGTLIEHIGSTAVPGLAAKPIIDIMIGLPGFALADALVPGIETLGYQYVSTFESEMPYRRYFRKPHVQHTDAARTHHLHMVEIGTDFWHRHLAFRDHLRANPERAAQYAALKRDLAGREWQDMNDYADAKTDFIRAITPRSSSRP